MEELWKEQIRKMAPESRESRKLRLQRERRARNQRIDYYVSDDARAVIEKLTFGSVGGDQSSVINRLVLAGAKRSASGISGRVAQARTRVMGSGSGGSDGDDRCRAHDDEDSAGIRRPRATAKVAQSSKPAARFEECGARTRKGTPCRCWPEPGKRRCRLHGGKSTGPRTTEGRTRARSNLLQFRADQASAHHG